MTDTSSILNLLAEISTIDGKITRANAERKKIENDLNIKRKSVKELIDSIEKGSKVLEERKKLYNKEEKRLREENEKLAARRKALATFSNYKLQQAAEKEIEHAALEVLAQEESLLGSLDIIEQIQKKLEEVTNKKNEELQKFEGDTKDSIEHISLIEDRLATYSQERQSLALKINPTYMEVYSKVQQKYPLDPVVSIENNSCIGCFMQIGPQLQVEISRGKNLCKCPGCGRILYIKDVTP